jgi:hypothetical protein
MMGEETSDVPVDGCCWQYVSDRFTMVQWCTICTAVYMYELTSSSSRSSLLGYSFD